MGAGTRSCIVVGLVIAFSTSAGGQTPQDTRQQACINGLNGRLQQLAKVAGKNVSDCIRAGTRDDLPAGSTTIDECVAMDPSGKVQKAEGKTVQTEQRTCTVAPDFAVTDAATVNDAGRGRAEGYFTAAFGPNLDATIASESDMKTTAVCQRDIASLMGKCLATRLKVYNSCKKQALKSIGGAPPQAQTSAELAQVCLTEGDPSTGQPDPKGKIEKLCNSPEPASIFSDLLARKINKVCNGALPTPNPATSFPGCAAPGYAQVHRCLQHQAACRACLAITEADALSRDCDLFDNGMADGSCPG